MSIKKQKITSTIIIYLLSILLMCVFLFPLIWMVISSFKPEQRIFADLKSIRAFMPIKMSIENYDKIFNKLDMMRYIGNSLYYVLVMVIAGLGVNSLCGYALAKLYFPYRDFLLGAVIALIIIPLESIILPLYILTFRMKMMYSFLALILPFVANCFSIFLFRQFFLNIPNELIEAAYIDGTSPLYAFLRIVIPSSLPIYATVFILQFIEHWGDFLWPVLVTDGNTKTAQLALQTLFANQPVYYGPVLAALTVTTIPVVLMFLFFQKYYVQGITQSGIKG
jgi:ABC-type glycerol-3-phosphate transport system permease component